MKKIYFIIVLLLMPILVSGAGTKGAAFLKIPTGSKPIALGEAYTALSNDINSIYWNPGGLVYSQDKELMFMHNWRFLGSNYEYFALSLPSWGYGAFGCAISYLGYGNFQSYDRHYQYLGDFSAYDMALTLTYSQILNPVISFGGNLKYISEKIEDASGRAFCLDIGGRFHRPKTPFTLAFVIKNIGTPMKLEDEGYLLPLEAIFGGLYKLNRFTIPVDLGYSTDDGLKLSLGCEYRVADIMSIRGGYKLGANPGGLSGFRAGCGFYIKKLYLNYAFAPYSHLGNSHIVTLGVKI